MGFGLSCECCVFPLFNYICNVIIRFCLTLSCGCDLIVERKRKTGSMTLLCLYKLGFEPFCVFLLLGMPLRAL